MTDSTRKVSHTCTCVLCGLVFEIQAHQGDYPLCKHCWSRDHLREIDRLATERHKAERAGLPATLSLSEWLAITTYFRGNCAFCLTVGYSSIEKLTQENGLVAANVVPICRACAVHRRASWEAAIERVMGLSMEVDARV